jgi:hypothetical protein
LIAQKKGKKKEIHTFEFPLVLNSNLSSIDVLSIQMLKGFDGIVQVLVFDERHSTEHSVRLIVVVAHIAGLRVNLVLWKRANERKKKKHNREQ